MKTIDEQPGGKDGDLDMPLTIEGLEILCHKLSNEPKIRFCGVVNSMGRPVACGFKEKILPLNNEDQRKMLYIESSLELSMKSEFNDTLGNVNFIVTYRDNVALISIPMRQNYLLLMSVERNAEMEQIVKDTISHFESNGLLGRKNEPFSSNNSSTLFSECA